MREVFIAFDKTVSLKLLEKTLYAWDTEDYEPVAIQVKDIKNKTMVRLAAEAIAKGDYIIAPIGSKPGEQVQKFKKGQGVRVEACDPMVH